jgi:hypothetical protein
VLRDTDLHDLFKGQIVHLTPHTKTASRACHLRKVVQIMHEPETIKRHWPTVVVEWKEDGVDTWERVHRDNINLRPNTRNKTDKQDGDGPSSGHTVARVRVMTGKIKPIVLADNEEQGTLF